VGVQISAQQPAISPAQEKWLGALVKDLQAHRGRSAIMPGEYQPAIVHALAHAMNDALGNIGKTVFYTDPVACQSNQPCGVSPRAWCGTWRIMRRKC
jgi:molybdopterin-containing oxidoreductase family iron-sulfur binding subunit